MRYAITGHTRGIGAEIFKRLEPNIIGFSKSTGYDITDKRHRSKIIKESLDRDVFINNAHDGHGQTDLLIELYKEWYDQEKTIINVGSRITEIILPKDKLLLLEYQSQKLCLKSMCYNLSGRCTIKYKSFGYVGTEEILQKYPHFTEEDYISVAQAADIILS
jgi:hypothetical protein